MCWEWEGRIWMGFEESSISLKQSLVGGWRWRGEVGIDLEQEMFWKPLKAQLVLEVMHYLMCLICMTGGFLLSGVGTAAWLYKARQPVEGSWFYQTSLVAGQNQRKGGHWWSSLKILLIPMRSSYFLPLLLGTIFKKVLLTTYLNPW